MGRPHWLALYGGVLAAWGLLFAMQMPPEMAAAARLGGASWWEALCAPAPGLAGAPSVFVMWALMAGAMMAPTALPALATWDDLRMAGARGFGALLAGYLAVWLGFALLATAAQLALAGAGLVSALGESVSQPLTAALLACAGLWQFSPLKEACLSRCRRPLVLFMAHWQDGPWRIGLRLGLVCLGCCWALMALAFVGGTMNLIWMGGAMALMTLEKLPQLGRPLTRPVGAALLGAAVAALLV
ncbi:metal-binding protein [Rhodobaculum claviforme]|uniref:Metal-binding protein n=2 Tax=Rhodobaculum claviforme TaxID=1549854 RepID=A0A934WIW2_9RHOB|nr:metal-binding protein [Rhodobaculum claviforme]